MRQYVGHKMKFVVQGFPGPVTGVLVNEDQHIAYVKSEAKEEIWRIPRNHICGFTVLDGEPEDFTPILVLACDCKNIGCPGVQYVKRGPGFSQKDIEVFTSPCPCKTQECRVGSKGELRGMSSRTLSEMLGGMLFGDYPEKKEAKRANRSGQPGAKTERGPAAGGGTVEGEKPVERGTGQPTEEAGGGGSEVPEGV